MREGLPIQSAYLRELVHKDTGSTGGLVDYRTLPFAQLQLISL